MKPIFKCPDSLISTWEELSAASPSKKEGSTLRRYKRLSLDLESGIRLSCKFPEKSWELLVEITNRKAFTEYSFPLWKGLAFEILELDVPEKDSTHLCLRLESEDNKEIFLILCSDLVQTLNTPHRKEDRPRILQEYIERWANFFEKYNPGGLSSESQRGLFGELWWLRELLLNKISPASAIKSWKGCKKNYQDFDFSGKAIEVKTTLSKEPRKVFISNERQLDETGLVSLALLVLTLISAEVGGETLPSLISSLRNIIKTTPSAIQKFNNSLIDAGYLDSNEKLYSDSYTVKHTELFSVKAGFPRIIALPNGTGDLKYSLLVSAAEPYKTEVKPYITGLKGN